MRAKVARIYAYIVIKGRIFKNIQYIVHKRALTRKNARSSVQKEKKG